MINVNQDLENIQLFHKVKKAQRCPNKPLIFTSLQKTAQRQT